ncbi:hypothetical protein CERZMDRAFT_85966 [Cercospora zeae-maydis SCOH1-5]|uniref:Uncharacterized protein n=1 Tax=Cercospora zeae-maydis SCOH1-5 TaxID=717836 RepID=A0A6A6FB53_9PEZI|nr:hypothetical protein CERZMDRAFT_85966 [Cercospora zeae-maydis SCOH1-5]
MAHKKNTRLPRRGSKTPTHIQNSFAAMNIKNSASEQGSEDLVAAGNGPIDDTTTVDVGREKPFRLLDLPDELIVRIIKSAVVMSSRKHPMKIRAIPVDEAPFWWHYPQLEVRISSEQSEKLIQPAITRVCRSLREEGLQAFYELNHFLVKASTRAPNALCRWIDPLVEDCIDGIANLFVEWNPRDGDFEKEIAWLRVVESRISFKTKTFVRPIKAREGKKPQYQVAYVQPKKSGDTPKGAGEWLEVPKNKKQN